MNDVRRPVALATASIVDQIYRPIWRGYFAAFSLYYLFMLPTHVWQYEGSERTVMVMAATAAACVSIWSVWRLRLDVSSVSMTPILLTMNGLIVLNIFAAPQLQLRTRKASLFLDSSDCVRARKFKLQASTLVNRICWPSACHICKSGFLGKFCYLHIFNIRRSPRLAHDCFSNAQSSVANRLRKK